MKRIMTVTERMRVLLSLAIVVILLFVKDVLDKRNIVSLGSSFSSVYEDRLLPESYIYQMSEHLYQKKLLFDNLDSNGANPNVQSEVIRHNTALLNLIGAFEKTQLTPPEAAYFFKFKRNVAAMAALEQGYLKNAHTQANLHLSKRQIDNFFNLASTDLKALSGIQLAEGKRLTTESKKIIAGSNLLSRFQLALLLIIPLLLLALAISKNINHVPLARPELN